MCDLPNIRHNCWHLYWEQHSTLRVRWMIVALVEKSYSFSNNSLQLPLYNFRYVCIDTIVKGEKNQEYEEVEGGDCL